MSTKRNFKIGHIIHDQVLDINLTLTKLLNLMR